MWQGNKVSVLQGTRPLRALWGCRRIGPRLFDRKKNFLYKNLMTHLTNYISRSYLNIQMNPTQKKYRQSEKGRKCRANYRRRWRKLYPEKHAAENARRSARHQKWITDFKLTKPCACGETDPVALDFHHIIPRNGQPPFSFAVSLTRIKAEVEKCIVICANCHRKGHAGRPRPEHLSSFASTPKM